MYCPKCATQNPEADSYCRSCGEDLTVIVQVMKKHLPVALISKLDAAIERKDERLRRDAILSALAAVMFAVLAIFRQAPLDGMLWALLAFVTLLGAIREYLAYRLSLDHRAKLSSDNESSPLQALPKQFDSYHCPQCQTENTESVSYCRSCGYRLKRRSQLETYLPAVVVHHLYNYIERRRNEEPSYKSNKVLLLVAVPLIMQAITRGINGEWLWMTLAIFMFFMTVIAGGWDLLAYRRRLPEGQDTAPSIDMADFFLLRGFNSLPEAEMVNELLVQQGIRSVAQAGNVFSPNAVILVRDDDFELAEDLYEEFFGTGSFKGNDESSIELEEETALFDRDAAEIGEAGARGKQTISLIPKTGSSAEPPSVTEATTTLLDAPHLSKSRARSSITEQTTDSLTSQPKET